jgi:predicted nucleotidyltransferase
MSRKENFRDIGTIRTNKNETEFNLSKGNFVNDITAIKDELDILTRIIIETVPAEQIYLFGSYAYGTPHKDSDLDLYVVLKDDAPMREVEAMDAIYTASYKKKTMPLDLLILKKNRFLDRKNAPTLERKILREGIKIYG